MRILILHPHYWPEIAATAQLLTDLAEDLVVAGHEVEVVAGQPSYRPSALRLPAREVRRGVHVTRVPSYRPRERQGARRVAHYLSYFAASLAPTLWRPADVILALSPPPLLCGLSGALARRISGTPFVYVVEDLYPELAHELGAIGRGGLRGLGRVARRIHEDAGTVIAISDEIAARLRAQGLPAHRIETVHNWADTDAIRPSSRDNPLRRELGLGDGFVALYAGNVSRTLGLSGLVEAAVTLRDRDVQIVVSGEGDARADLEREARARGAHAIRFVPSQPRERLAELLALGDVGLVTTRRGEQGLRFPSKLFGVMAAGRPVLATTDERELRGVVERARAGVVVPAEDGQALARALESLRALEPAERAAMGQRARAACEARFDRRRATERYREILERTAASATPRGAARPSSARGRDAAVSVTRDPA
jgi:glycosyltransferase involved in cell wall biosynthesis